jgi:hypothetical protein
LLILLLIKFEKEFLKIIPFFEEMYIIIVLEFIKIEFIKIKLLMKLFNLKKLVIK